MVLEYPYLQLSILQNEMSAMEESIANSPARSIADSPIRSIADNPVHPIPTNNFT
jgi:hypothetical protein